MTGLAPDSKKAFLEPTALEIGFELVFDVGRKRTPLGHSPIPKPRIVLGHQRVEQRRLGPMP
jgi:hypothetical protein